MKNRIICLLLAMIMVATLLCSCKDNKDPAGGKEPGQGQGGGGGEETVSYPWTNEELIFQMNMNTNGGQLSSMCKRYLAGAESGGTAVDDMVVARNGAAYGTTKVTVHYEYWNTTDNADWGASNEIIVRLCKSMDPMAPDMYCSFVYDMMAALLQGSFANIVSDTRGTNYLRINDDDYQAKVDLENGFDDEGYMYEYMASMTLSEKNVYLIASDYFIDTIRAFFVVPVNIALLEGDAAKAVTGGDGSYETFIEDVVKELKWDYSKLMQYCEAVKQVNPANGSYDLNGGVVGWALASDSGLSASGLIYTTTVTIIERTGDTLATLEFGYPKDNEELVNLSKNIATLMGQQGAVTGGYGAINTAFTQGRVLFGGIINVGRIEETDFQNMMGNGGAGVGVVPVPLYRSNTFDKAETDADYVMDSYRTQIHNNGRIGAIAANTTQFSACTAFLNYQSMNSTDILNEYYEWNLAKGAAGNISGNVDMLNYIRENVRSAFDKVFEDAISEYKGLTAWHKAIQNGYYAANGVTSTSYGSYKLGEEMRTAYEKLYAAKKSTLDGLRDTFEAAGGFSSNN